MKKKKMEKINGIFTKFLGKIENETVLLDGGQGNCYRNGDFVIKPVDDVDQNIEIAELMCKVQSKDLRLQQPIKSLNNNWIEDGKSDKNNFLNK
jgi:hypothetical protein